MTILALAEGTLRAVFGPSRAAEASDPVFIHTGLGDVIPNGIGQTGVRDAAWTAFALWNHCKLTVSHRSTRYRPAVHFPPHALALLAVLHPGLSITVRQQTVLMQTLRTQTRVAFRTAQHIHCGILTITHHPSTHHQPRLTGADRAPVVIQHPNLPVVFHLPVMGAVTRAVPTVRTAAVITSVNVKAHGVISTAVPPHLTFINVFA